MSGSFRRLDPAEVGTGLNLAGTANRLRAALAERGVRTCTGVDALSSHVNACEVARGAANLDRGPLCPVCALSMALMHIDDHETQVNSPRGTGAPRALEAVKAWRRFRLELEALETPGLGLPGVLGPAYEAFEALDKWVRTEFGPLFLRGYEAPETILPIGGVGPKQHPLKLRVLRQLRRGGFKMREIAELVVDEHGEKGRAERYRKLLARDPRRPDKSRA